MVVVLMRVGEWREGEGRGGRRKAVVGRRVKGSGKGGREAQEERE